jgi:hypothetical protein
MRTTRPIAAASGNSPGPTSAWAREEALDALAHLRRLIATLREASRFARDEERDELLRLALSLSAAARAVLELVGEVVPSEGFR